MSEAARARSGSSSSSSFEVKVDVALASSAIDSSSASAITGMATLRSRIEPMPPCAAVAIVASLPMTRAVTMIAASAITGLTLPGMIELPGWTAGSLSSPRPPRGPDPIHLMSLAILPRLVAMVLRWPETSTQASRACCASK
jgi:hypothetical protein